MPVPMTLKGGREGPGFSGESPYVRSYRFQRGKRHVCKGQATLSQRVGFQRAPILGDNPTYATPFDAKRPKSAWQHVGEELIYGISHAIVYSINASRGLSAIAEFLFYLTPLSQIYLKLETFEIECFK